MKILLNLDNVTHGVFIKNTTADNVLFGVFNRRAHADNMPNNRRKEHITNSDNMPQTLEISPSFSTIEIERLDSCR